MVRVNDGEVLDVRNGGETVIAMQPLWPLGDGSQHTFVLPTEED